MNEDYLNCVMEENRKLLKELMLVEAERDELQEELAALKEDLTRAWDASVMDVEF